jgi:hypothetical protein
MAAALAATAAAQRTGSVKSYENDQSAARCSRERPLIEVAHIQYMGTEQHLSMWCFG